MRKELTAEQQDLVRRYYPLVVRTAVKMRGKFISLDDAVQDGCLGLIDSVSRYNKSGSFIPYATLCIKGAILDGVRNATDKRRKGGRVSFISVDDVVELYSQEPGPEEQMLRRERKQQISSAIRKIPRQERIWLVLHYWHEMSYTDIAEKSNYTGAVVSERLARVINTEIKRGVM